MTKSHLARIVRAFLLAFSLTAPVCALAQVIAIEMLDGERVVGTSPFPAGAKEGKDLYFTVQAHDPAGKSRGIRLFRVRDIRQAERGHYFKGNNLLGDPCGFEWRFQLEGERDAFVSSQPVLVELPNVTALMTASHKTDLLVRGRQNRDASPYGGRFIRTRCSGQPNFVADGLPVAVLDPTTRTTHVRHLNLARVAKLETLAADRLAPALAHAAKAIVTQLQKPESLEAHTPSPPPSPQTMAERAEKRDADGRRILQGPLGPGTYWNVRIISSGIGVDASGDSTTTTVMNSVIEAPICVRSSGFYTTLSGNELNCELCVEFVGERLINSTLTNNRCSGRGTNRPDVFGW